MLSWRALPQRVRWRVGTACASAPLAGLRVGNVAGYELRPIATGRTGATLRPLQWAEAIGEHEYKFCLQSWQADPETYCSTY
jgi:hypothetical protein